MSDEVKKGGISVETEHLFPIIKKWLYSEKDIFLREIVSNAVDAITKLKRLCSLGEATVDESEPYRVTVFVDKKSGTLTVKDNGIGMTEEEVDRYICQIALSGALEFIEKYETPADGEKSGTNESGIIGHFGLGFYSAFMVSDQVELVTKSYTGAPAVDWVCNDAGSYEVKKSDKEDRGTSVIMHISDEEKAYLDPDKIKGILNKYCMFMPVEIYFVDENAPKPKKKKDKDKDKEEEDDSEKPVNTTEPLWLKPASACTDEEYIDFYHKVFNDYREPLFWIHLNADYPLNFKGILYFPKITNEYESLEGQVKLFYHQVFVADNIKEVIPEYLLMLKGVLDCPELPLNVSRSYLQDDAYVKRVSDHIVKKVADKLNSLCKNDREKYEKVWGDIRTFVEYACLRERKFYDRVKKSILFMKTDGKCVTADEYLEAAGNPEKKNIYYTTDKALQAQYISLYDAQNIAVVELNHPIDTQFVSTLEGYETESGIHFLRVDAETDALKADTEAKIDDKVKEKLTELFRKVSKNEKLEVTYTTMKDESVPAMLVVSEQSRRFEDMMKMYSAMGMGGNDGFPVEYSLHVNLSSGLISKLISLEDSDAEKAEFMASYLYQLAVLAQRKMTADELQAFLSSGFDLLGKL